MNNFYTYALYDLSEAFAPFYIGKGCKNRMYIHEQNAKKGKLRNKHLQNKILQILNADYCVGYHKFVENVDESIALETEQRVIKNLRNAGIKLCNLTDGGEGVSGMKHTDAEKERIRSWNKTFWSPQERERMSNAMKGKKNHLGFKNSEEVRKKMSVSQKGKHNITEESRKKMSESAKRSKHSRSHPHTEEAKKRIGLASKNMSDETRNKIRESVKKIWLLRKQNKEQSNG